jgi:hypothetical protein
VNTWLLLVVMSLAVYRLTRLVIKDTFPPVLWMRDRVAGGWRALTPEEWGQVHEKGDGYTSPKFTVSSRDGEAERWVVRWGWSPQWLADLASCAWCASGWISLALTAGVAFTIGVPAPLLTWPAVWGAGALLASREWA